MTDPFEGHFPERVVNQKLSGVLSSFRILVRQFSNRIAKDGWLDDARRATLRGATLRVKDDFAGPWIYSAGFAAAELDKYHYQVMPEFLLPIYDEAFGSKGVEPLASLLLERPVLGGFEKKRLGDVGAISLFRWLAENAHTVEQKKLVATVIANVLENAHHLTSWFAVEWFEANTEYIAVAVEKLISDRPGGRRRASEAIEAACALEFLSDVEQAAATEPKIKVRTAMHRTINTLHMLSFPLAERPLALETLDSMGLESIDSTAKEIVESVELRWNSGVELSKGSALWLVSRLGLLGPERIDPLLKDLVDALDPSSRASLAELIAIAYKHGAHGRVLLDPDAERALVLEAMKAKTAPKRKGPVSALVRSRGPVARLWLLNEACHGSTYRRREHARSVATWSEWSPPELCSVTTPLATTMLKSFMDASVAFFPAEWGDRFSQWAPLMESLIFVSDGRYLFLEDIANSNASTKIRIAHPSDIPPAEHRNLKKALKERGVIKQPFKQLRKTADSTALPIRDGAKKMAGRLRRLGYVLGPEFDIGASSVAMRSLSTCYEIVLGTLGLLLRGSQLDGVECVIEYVKVYPIKNGSPPWALLGEDGRHQDQRAIPEKDWPDSVAFEVKEDLKALAK